MIIVDGVARKTTQLHFSAGFPDPDHDESVWTLSGSTEDYACGFTIDLPQLTSWKELANLQVDLEGMNDACFFESGAEEIDQGFLEIGKRDGNSFPVVMQFGGAGHSFSVNSIVPFEYLAISFYRIGSDLPTVPVAGFEEAIRWEEFQPHPLKVDRFFKGKNMGHWRFFPATN